jgi:hypothetical protein
MKQLVIVTAVLLVTTLFVSCEDDPIAQPPEIKAFVNGEETTEATVTGGETVNYSFDITAYETITDLKLIIFDVITPEVKVPSQNLVAGLAGKLNETVTGTFVARENAEYKLIVKDAAGNEVSKSIHISVQ